jgi:hypothetical protein
MEIVFSDDGRDFVRREWSHLVTADPAGTFFHTPQFLKLYWEEFVHGQEQLLLAFAEEDGAQVGAVAFERTGPRLRFLGGTEVTDYMGRSPSPRLRAASPRSCWRRWSYVTTGLRRTSGACPRIASGSSGSPKPLRRKGSTSTWPMTRMGSRPSCRSPAPTTST